MGTDVGTEVALVALLCMEDVDCPHEGSRHCHGFGHRLTTLPAASAHSKGSTRAPQQHCLLLMTGRLANNRRQEIRHANEA